MKLSKLKRLLDEIFEYRTYYVHRKCLIEYIIRDNSNNICRDCKYSCINRHECGVKMKDKIIRAFKDRKYYIYRNCALEDLMRNNNDYACKDCKYNYIGKCMLVGLMVLK